MSEFFKNMGTGDWIAFIDIRKTLIDFNDTELDSLRIYLGGLDNNGLLEFVNRYESKTRDYKTFLIFINVLFDSDEVTLFRLKRKLESLKITEGIFLESANRLKEILQKTP